MFVTKEIPATLRGFTDIYHISKALISLRRSISRTKPTLWHNILKFLTSIIQPTHWIAISPQKE